MEAHSASEVAKRTMCVVHNVIAFLFLRSFSGATPQRPRAWSGIDVAPGHSVAGRVRFSRGFSVIYSGASRFQCFQLQVPVLPGLPGSSASSASSIPSSRCFPENRLPGSSASPKNRLPGYSASSIPSLAASYEQHAAEVGSWVRLVQSGKTRRANCFREQMRRV